MRIGALALQGDFREHLAVVDRLGHHGVERHNRARVAREQYAQAQRAAQPVKHHRVDTKKPMFDLPTPSFGGGAIHPAAAIFVLIFGVIAAWRLRRIGLIS